MISIIVPVYNCISSLEGCIGSIQKQTLTDWELLLVDDGSTDGSGSLCDEFASSDNRVRVLHKPNGGVSSARNTGLDFALGEYVMFCDSDDTVASDWCEKLLAAQMKFPQRLPICNYYRKTADAITVNYNDLCRAVGECIPPIDMFYLYQLQLIGIPWNKLYRREILLSKGIRFPEDLSLGEDLLFNLAYIAEVSDGFVFVNETLYNYTFGSCDSLSVSYYDDLVGIYHRLFAGLKKSLFSVSGAYEKYEKAYFHAYFFAFDRVFRNTWSVQNGVDKRWKWNYNSTIFHSPTFQSCRNFIKKTDINILQYYGLKSNSFRIYWASVIISEKISRMLHRA